MKHDLVCQEFGFRWLRREAFFGECKISPFNDPKDDLAEWHELQARVARLDGAWVVFDPSDSAEGWCLVGDDLSALLHQTADRILDSVEV